MESNNISIIKLEASEGKYITNKGNVDISNRIIGKTIFTLEPDKYIEINEELANKYNKELEEYNKQLVEKQEADIKKLQEKFKENNKIPEDKE